MKGTLVFSAIAAAFVSSAAMAQSFNINFAPTAGVPVDSTYGAAAGQTGQWNQITFSGVHNLLNLDGSGSGVQLSLTGGTFLNLLNSLPNGAATPAGSNAERLLDSLWDPGVNATITITGLAPGTYDFYTYAVAPDSATAFTGVNVGGTGVQSVGGTLPNPFLDNYAQGLTHALHTVVIGGGAVPIDITLAGGSWRSVNGIQIFLVPAPGALALLGLAGVVGSRRRRE